MANTKIIVSLPVVNATDGSGMKWPVQWTFFKVAPVNTSDGGGSASAENDLHTKFSYLESRIKGSNANSFRIDKWNGLVRL